MESCKGSLLLLRVSSRHPSHLRLPLGRGSVLLWSLLLLLLYMCKAVKLLLLLRLVPLHLGLLLLHLVLLVGDRRRGSLTVLLLLLLHLLRLAALRVDEHEVHSGAHLLLLLLLSCHLQLFLPHSPHPLLCVAILLCMLAHPFLPTRSNA